MPQDRKVVAAIRKLLGQSDVDAVHQGLALAVAVGAPELWALLAGGAGLRPDGGLTHGPEITRRVRARFREEVTFRALRGTGALSMATRLSLNNCDTLSDLDAVRGLDALISLHVPNATELVDVRGLTELPSLRLLNLGGCRKAEGLPVLGSLTQLAYLDLRGWTIPSLTALADLTALRTLFLRGCRHVADLDTLARFTDLRYLDLSHGPSLTRADSLVGLTHLKNLALAECTSLENIDALAHLPNLATLDLRGCTGLPAVQRRLFSGRRQVEPLQRLLGIPRSASV
jgi:Leucine-rich repeat (LRR) protein